MSDEKSMSAPVAEYALIGALLQEHDRVFPVCQEVGITSASFTDVRCARAWDTMAELRERHKPVELVSVSGSYGGDSFDAVTELEPMMNACSSPASAFSYALEIREAERRRTLSMAARVAQDRLARGDGIADVLDELRTAGEAVGMAIGGPLVSTFPPLRFSQLQQLEVNTDDYILGRGWLRRGAWSLFTGGTGTGKSVAVEQIAACLSCGKAVFGLNVSRPFKVLLLTAENDGETLKRDLGAIAEHEGLDTALLDANLQIHHAYALDGMELVTALESELRRGGFDLLILDNYQTYSGATDLNDSAAWKTFITPLVRLLKEYGVAMLLVDHTGKPAERNHWGRHDSVYLAAGTSRKANGARTSAELYSPVGEDERYRFHLGKNWERAGVVDEHGFIVRDIYLDRAPDASRPYWTPSADQLEYKQGSKGEAEVVAYLVDHPVPKPSIRKIADAVGVSKSQVGKILNKHPELSRGVSDDV